jgi:flagellar biogenesis protein FliO
MPIPLMPIQREPISGDKTGGLAGWLLALIGRQPRPRPNLALLERITLAPRQSLSLVEADGRRFLIATSADGAPAFYALGDSPRRPRRDSARTGSFTTSRISW